MILRSCLTLMKAKREINRHVTGGRAKAAKINRKPIYFFLSTLTTFLRKAQSAIIKMQIHRLLFKRRNIKKLHNQCGTNRKKERKRGGNLIFYQIQLSHFSEKLLYYFWEIPFDINYIDFSPFNCNWK